MVGFQIPFSLSHLARDSLEKENYLTVLAWRQKSAVISNVIASINRIEAYISGILNHQQRMININFMTYIIIANVEMIQSQRKQEGEVPVENEFIIEDDSDHLSTETSTYE